jgi:hypothetical protein
MSLADSHCDNLHGSLSYLVQPHLCCCCSPLLFLPIWHLIWHRQIGSLDWLKKREGENFYSLVQDLSRARPTSLYFFAAFLCELQRFFLCSLRQHSPRSSVLINDQLKVSFFIFEPRSTAVSCVVLCMKVGIFHSLGETEEVFLSPFMSYELCSFTFFYIDIRQVVKPS